MPIIYSLTISASDIGSRVMVRRTLAEGFGDVVGDLVAWSASALTINTRRGPVVVPLADVVAGKRVPPAVPRRRTRARTDDSV